MTKTDDEDETAHGRMTSGVHSTVDEFSFVQQTRH